MTFRNSAYFSTSLWIKPFVNYAPNFIMNKQTKSDKSLANPKCHICRSEISDSTYRFLIVKDKMFQKHKMLSFHYFFPCWDLEYTCRNLEDYEIFKAGFCCDQSMLENPQAITNLKRNEALWDLEVIS